MRSYKVFSEFYSKFNLRLKVIKTLNSQIYVSLIRCLNICLSVKHANVAVKDPYCTVP